MKQKGTITKIEGSKLHITVCPQSACEACKAKVACDSMGGSGKELILVQDGIDRNVGDEVTLMITSTQGFKAALLVYLLPIVIIITMIYVLQQLEFSDGVAAGIALGVLVVYLIVLRLFRNKIEREFTITIE